MAELFLAGNVNSISYTHTERLVDLLTHALASFQVTKLITTTDRWAAAKKEICETYKLPFGEVENNKVSEGTQHAGRLCICTCPTSTSTSASASCRPFRVHRSPTR